MARSRAKNKKRSDAGQYFVIPHHIMDYPDWQRLTPNAIRLLLELLKQYNGRNNGDFTAAWTIMQKRGFHSQTTLNDALKCLMDLQYIIRTREGRFCNPGKRCALYAVTWLPIHDCPGKDLEISATSEPYRTFSIHIEKPSPETVVTGSRKWSDEVDNHA